MPTLQLICRYALVLLLLHAQGCENSNTGTPNTAQTPGNKQKTLQAYVAGGGGWGGMRFYPPYKHLTGASGQSLQKG